MPSKAKHTSKARTAKPLPSREKVRAHRARLRAHGLRPITIWVPDTRSPKFLTEARRQARLLAESLHEKEDQAFIDAISEWKP